MITSNYKERTESLYQPGGTATVVLDKWVSMIKDSGKDAAGIWLWVTYGGSQTQQITVISAYRVCKNTIAEAGLSTAWMQQWKHHREKGRVNPDPCKLFLTGLFAFIDLLSEKGHEIMLNIDRNEEDRMGNNLHRFVQDQNLVNVHRHLHPDAEPLHTYMRGQKCIDFIFITP
eukprot:4157524-Ditylum_brightwellii.AAC.1